MSNVLFKTTSVSLGMVSNSSASFISFLISSKAFSGIVFSANFVIFEGEFSIATPPFSPMTNGFSPVCFAKKYISYAVLPLTMNTSIPIL